MRQRLTNKRQNYFLFTVLMLCSLLMGNRAFAADVTVLQFDPTYYFGLNISSENGAIECASHNGCENIY